MPTPGARVSLALTTIMACGCSASAFPVAPQVGAAQSGGNSLPRTTREVIRAESERTGASIDADTLFGKLVDRYRGLALYQDSVKLAHRTVERTAQPSSSVQQSMGCTVDGTTLAVISSALGTGGSCDAQDASPLAKLELARQLWTLPHLALRFAEEPLRSMRGGCGTLVPTQVDEVTIDQKQLLRLHLTSERDPTGAVEVSCEESTVDLFVNPQSLLVERVEHSHTIAEGVRYEATLEITPERAVTTTPAAATPPTAPTAPTATPSPILTPAPPTDVAPAPQPIAQPAAQPTPPPAAEPTRQPATEPRGPSSPVT